MNTKNIFSFATGAVIFVMSSLVSAAPGDTSLISVRDPDLALLTASGDSSRASISVSGRYVAFTSSASNLVPNDTNRRTDVFVYDREHATIERVSVGAEGAESNSDSSEASISADGRYVAFSSSASNLVPNDTNEGTDIFVYDRQAQTTSRVNVNSAEEQASRVDSVESSGSPAISGNGLFVVFASDADNFVPGSNVGPNQLYVRDIANGLTYPVSVASGGALANEVNLEPAISAEGRYVVFTSWAANLVANDTNGVSDIFVRDTQSETTKRVSVTSSGAEASGDFPLSSKPSISADGRLIAFASDATNLVSDDANGSTDVFLHDQQSGTTRRVSLTSQGAEANGSSGGPFLSANGSNVSFQSSATNLVASDTNDQPDVFVRNLNTNKTLRISVTPTSGEQPNGGSGDATLSGEGRYITYGSIASNIVAGDRNDLSDIFLRVTTGGATRLVSAAKLPSQTAPGASQVSRDRAVSADGKAVVFRSDASILVDQDANQTSDIFARDIQGAVTTLISRSTTGNPANSGSFDSAISSTGQFVAFQSFAGNLVPGDTNETFDIFLHDRQTGSVSRVNLGPNGQEAEQFSSNAAPTLSASGRYVAFDSSAQLTPNAAAVNAFVRDNQLATTSKVNSDGVPGLTPSMSSTGRYIAYDEDGNVYVLDQTTGVRQLVSVNNAGQAGNAVSSDSSISADGRYVAFQSLATNLVPGELVPDTERIYVRDRLGGKTTLVSVDSFGEPANTDAFEASLSGNGRFVAFYSAADNLTANDTNNLLDVFVHDRLTGVTTLESVDSNGVQSNGDSLLPSLSYDGSKVVFTSGANNLVVGDFNGDADVFQHEHRSPTVIRINTGGGGFTDSKGHFWKADHGYNAGQASTYVAPIANTDDDALYRTERWDAKAQPDLQYSLSVPNGTYIVRLHFAENYAPNFGRMRRVFNVEMQGEPTFTDLDVFAEAGAQTALIKTATVTVTDGHLNIAFLHRIQNPIINAIEVVGQ